MTAIDQLRDEIANLHLLADRLARAGVDKPTIEECVKTYREAHQRSPHSSMVANHHDGIAAVRDLCLASRNPSEAPNSSLIEAADAMRGRLERVMRMEYGDAADLTKEIVAYDAARSRHASGAQPDSACDEIGWLVEITGPRYWTGTPGCGNWTADSLAAMRFARRQDAEAACRHLAPSGAIPVEHAWVSHRPAGAQPSGAPAPASAQGEVCECGHGRAMHFDEDGDHACLYQMNDNGKPFCRCDMFRAKDKERA